MDGDRDADSADSGAISALAGVSPTAPITSANGIPVIRERINLGLLRGTGRFRHVVFLRYNEMSTHLLNPTEWRRDTRGREIQFFACMHEIREWLTDVLPGGGADWWFVGHQSSRGPTGWSWSPFRFPVRSLDRSNSMGRVDLWLWSASIGPPFDVIPSDEVCSLSGLIVFQPGWRNSGDESTEPSRFAKCTRVRSTLTGEPMDLTAYEETYSSIVRRAKRDLVHRTLVTFPDGSSVPASSIKMTQAMVDRFTASKAVSRWRPEFR